DHRGIDLGGDVGEAVHAPAAGVVSFAGTVPGSGRSVTIETPDGWSVTLTHLGSITAGKGATVAEGDGVGTIGPSGEPGAAASLPRNRLLPRRPQARKTSQARARLRTPALRLRERRPRRTPRPPAPLRPGGARLDRPSAGFGGCRPAARRRRRPSSLCRSSPH